MRSRFLFINVFFLILFSVIEYKLYHLQVVKRDYYFEKAESLTALQKENQPERGRIFFTDRHGNNIPVAMDKEFPLIYASPKAIPAEKKESTAELLAPVVNDSIGNILEKIESQSVIFRIIQEKAPEEIAKNVTSLGLEGVHVEPQNYRYYPFNSLAAQVIGFVGKNEDHPIPTGLYGVEKLNDKTLRNQSDTKLTIDRNLQAQSEQILENLIAKFHADGGSVIIMDPKNGKILTLANFPTFDPNNYGSAEISSFLNPVAQSVYEPGSVFKPITMAAGIDMGVISPETTFFDSGSVTLNGKKITNWDHKAHGQVTMTNVIESSINTGTVFAVQKIGRNKFKEYVKKFGFGEKTSVDLPDEISGSIQNLERKNSQDIDYAAASFGQGTAVTSIQMLNAFAALANKGALMRPYLNQKEKPKIMRQVVSEDAASKVTAMMESAVNKAGVASLSQYRIAGKTGTAQIADLKHGGYLEEYIHTFIGYGPVSDPKFVALIKIDRPDVELAGQTVVPAFKELAQFILSYYNLPPDKNLPTGN